MTDILETLKKEKALYEYTGPDAVVSGAEILEKIKNQPRNPLRLWSRMPKLDSILDGFHGGQLVVVSGITGNGKTTFCRSVTMASLEQSIKTTWLSYEEANEDFLGQFERIDKDYCKFIFMPGEMAGKGLGWTEDRMWESKLKHDAHVVFIDHLHFLVDMRTRYMSADIGDIVRGLKLLALKHNLIIFLICHTTKTKNDGTEELSLGDVRDSSFIEQEADIVLYVWRDIDTETEAFVKVAKNRKRGIINKKIRLVYENGRLREKSNAVE